MKKAVNFSLIAIVIVFFSSCIAINTIRGGEVGVKRQVGKIQPEIMTPGVTVYSPLFATVFKIPTTTTNKKVDLSIPSKEGLTIQAEMSILYRIVPEKAPEIVEHIGLDFEEVVIMPVFRSALANTSAKFYAKDMHSGKRAEIEKTVRTQMMEELTDRGFVIEAVLMKRIVLPAGLSKAIEYKLEAEQDAQRMEFTLQKEQKQAERNVIEAEGKKKVAIIEAEAISEQKLIDAEADKKSAILRAEGIKESNELITKGLNEDVLKFKAIEAYEKLATSSNAKTIISDGTATVLNMDSK